MHIAVVGAGIMGLWSSYQLLKRGHDVTVFEGYELFNTKGSSGGLFRSWRIGADDPAMGESYALWRQFESEIGETLLDSCGERWDEYGGGSKPGTTESGLIYARRTQEVLVRYIESSGGIIHPYTRVISVDPNGTVFFNGTSLLADRVVLTTGPDPLFHLQCAEVQDFVYLTAKLSVDVAPYSFVSKVHMGPDHGCYGQVSDGMLECKMFKSIPRSSDIDKYKEWLMQCMRGQNLSAVEASIMFRPCKYTMRHVSDSLSIDSYEIVQPYVRGRLVYSYGYNGHGFKYSPLVGRNIAEFVGRPLPPSNAFGLEGIAALHMDGHVIFA